jgi:hypothetical protein
MNKRLSPFLAVIFLTSALSVRAAANDKPQTWKGVVTLVCAAAPPAGSPQAASSVIPAADACRFTLFTPSDKKLYVLNPQEQAAKYSKKAVTVTGTLSSAKTKVATADGVVDASTIVVAKIAPVPGT